MEKFKKAILRDISYYRKKPFSAHLELTHRCNLSCEFCGFREQSRERMQNELLTNEWFKIIDELVVMKIKNIILVGAEPLVRKDIQKIIAYIKEKKIYCLLITNGILLDEVRSKFLVESKIDKIAVSIDGPEEIHDKIRGRKGAFKSAINGIKNLIKVRQNFRSLLPRIEIHTTICSSNVRYLDMLPILSKELGIDDLSFQYLTETKEQVVNDTVFQEIKIATTQFIPKDHSLLINQDEMQILHKKLKQIINYRINNLSISILRSLSEAYLTKGLFPIKKCFTVRTDILIDPYGNLFPCTMARNYILGNVLKKNIWEIWNSMEYADFRNSIKRNFFPICNYCCHFNSNLTFGQALKVFFCQKL